VSPAPWAGDPPVTEALAAELGVTSEEFARILKVLGRPPTYSELSVFSVMWSEHCSYKSSRVHLKRLPTEGPQVVQGPGENAGAVDIGDGWCAVFKMESHNHPSFIEPYHGAATGVGGILRDVFTMGARPIASLNSLRFGRPDHAKTPQLIGGVVAGIGGYGNCIGVPTVGGEVQFDTSYDGNILVNAFTVGVARIDGLFFGVAAGIGNPVIYVGARTGRDGIHGATMASAEFDDESEKKLPTVQVGDPFMEKLLLDCCLEIFASGCLEGVQDMGAAGLTSSSVEMAGRAGNGIELDLDMIPRRTRGLQPYEMLLSESQERMLMVAKAGREKEVFDLCRKWDLEVAIVGRVTDTGRFVCKATPGYDPLADRPVDRAPVVVVDIPVGALTDDAPKYERPMRAPSVQEKHTIEMTAVGAASGIDAGAELRSLLSSPNIGSRHRIWRQYDHIVQAGTIIRPGDGDAGVVRVMCGEPGSAIEKYLAVAVDGNGRHVELDPYEGAAMIVAECTRNLACVGAKALGVTDCLNFGSPQNPETMWRFARAIDGIAAACRALDAPVVSGNVSLYNETDGRPILPTPTIAAVGALQSLDDRLELGFESDGSVVALLGPQGSGKLGGSEWFTQRAGKVSGEPLSIDLAVEAALQKTILELARARALESAHDVSDGGIAVALAECAIARGLGAHVKLPIGRMPLEAALFHEEPSRVIVSFATEKRDEVRRAAERNGVPFAVLGVVQGDRLVLEGVLDEPVSALRSAHRSALDAFFD
jgi:phosphoribosylformylglycinamidine synthase